MWKISAEFSNFERTIIHHEMPKFLRDKLKARYRSLVPDLIKKIKNEKYSQN